MLKMRRTRKQTMPKDVTIKVKLDRDVAKKYLLILDNEIKTLKETLHDLETPNRHDINLSQNQLVYSKLDEVKILLKVNKKIRNSIREDLDE